MEKLCPVCEKNGIRKKIKAFQINLEEAVWSCEAEETPGRLKLTDQHLIFKNQKTGKVEQISASDMEMVNYQKFIGTWGLRIFLKNGTLHRFKGFKESEQEKIAKFFSTNYKKDMLEKELSLKGWNWGTARFNGSVLSFDVGHHTAFEIPLYDVSQCNTGKNEVTLEFHQNDDAPVSLMEMRFHIPVSDSVDQDPVEAFHQQVMDKASVISVSGDAIAIFREIHCLTPRGRYDIKIFQTFFQLHGKTFDYKIPMSTVLRLFLLPHKDNRQMFFVVSLDPPIKQGQTRYHYLVLLFNQEEETSIELPFTEKELKEKYEDKLTKELSGPTFEVLGKVMKVIINRKLTGPGHFTGHTGTPAISCSFKAAAGYLYPLERGFIYVHKPPIHIRFEEIASDESDVAEEYDSNPNSSDSEDSDASAASHKKEKKDKEKKEKKEKKSKSAKTVSEKPRKQRKSKKERDENKPKRPPSAFMLWLSSTRDSIKADNPGLSITDIAKKGGEMWRELKDKSEWETKAAKAKKDYMASMKEYQTSGGGKEKTKEKKTENKKKETKKDSPSKQMSGSGFKSKEYISDDDSSSDESKKSAKEKSDNESEEEKDKKKKTEKRPTEDTGKKTSKKTKRNQSDESDEEEPIQSTPSSSEDESKSD
ncbi:FACT complex subunit Ssrp1 [Atta colombica]|uniref:FACT complex subunit SSRP1 n=1 Tax=Atta colombica TaxID=520822 RepID=A0A195BV87_9HYME|nr:FACT complex subunit Ssrp1 [Atta colombica]